MDDVYSNRSNGGRRRGIGIVSLALMLEIGCIFAATAQSENFTVALETPQAQLRVTGTLTMLDTAEGKGLLMTDLEKPVFFRLDRPDLFERLSIGDRVTIQLDEEGRAIKVIEALPAEIHEPPPPAK